MPDRLTARLRWAVRRRWWQRRGAVLVITANFAVAFALASTAALLGLVVEDLLPVSGDRHCSAARYALLGVTLLALLLALLWRRSAHGRTGTLFYVRLIDEAWQDWHVIPVQVASRRRMSLRSVTRWVDLPSRTRHGVIDLVDVCSEIASALEAVVNGDRDDTGYTIAPNMLWPAALAVGAELPIVDCLELLELSGRPDGSGGGITEISYPLPQPSASDAATPAPVPHRSGGTRVGLLLTFTARGLDPGTVFAGIGVGEYYRLCPEWFGVDLARGIGARFTGEQLATLAESLPPVVANIKQAAGDRDLVVAAAMPKTLAMALGWGLAQGACRFFAGIHLLHYDGRRYIPVRVHPAQP